MVGSTSNDDAAPALARGHPVALKYKNPLSPECPPVRRYGMGPILPCTGCTIAVGGRRQKT